MSHIGYVENVHINALHSNSILSPYFYDQFLVGLRLVITVRISYNGNYKLSFVGLHPRWPFQLDISDNAASLIITRCAQWSVGMLDWLQVQTDASKAYW